MKFPKFFRSQTGSDPALLGPFWYLRSTPLFEMLSDEEIMLLAEHIRLEIAVNKSVLSYSDHPESKVFFIKNGHVKIVHDVGDENEMIMDILGPGEFFGPLTSSPSKSPSLREEYASVIDTATICIFNRADFERTLREIPSMQTQILAIVAERAERITERLADMLFRTASERIFGFLQRLASRFGETVGSDTCVRIQLTHSEIGLLTGTSRQTVASVLSDLRQRGIVTVTQSQILLHSSPRAV